MLLTPLIKGLLVHGSRSIPSKKHLLMHRLPIYSQHWPFWDMFRSGVAACLCIIERLCERTEYVDIFLFFPPINQSCSVSDVLFTGGSGVSDFSVLK